EIIAIKEAYQRLFDRSLESDVKGDTSGSLKKILVSLLQANRDEGDNVDKDLAGQDAKDLYDAGEGRWGTDESTFNEVLAKRNHKQLRATFQAYQVLIGKDIEEAIEAETSGDLQKAYLTLVSPSLLRRDSALSSQQVTLGMTACCPEDSSWGTYHSIHDSPTKIMEPREHPSTAWDHCLVSWGSMRFM
ncbi:Annexin A13, partial [Eschrichtius robustus]|nr:Annexin A13 [Eschrichtius robustus]